MIPIVVYIVQWLYTYNYEYHKTHIQFQFTKFWYYQLYHPYKFSKSGSAYYLLVIGLKDLIRCARQRIVFSQPIRRVEV